MGKGVSRKVLVKRHGDRFWGKVLGNDSGEIPCNKPALYV
jgi:hypothetical protein